MQNNGKTGVFIVEVVIDTNGVNCTLWIINMENPSHIKAFQFVGVEADSVIEVLDRVYKWIDDLDYNFVSSEIIVCNLQEFGVLLGKQGYDSLWSRDFGDYVSYCAGAWGMSQADTVSVLMRPVMLNTGMLRYQKMAKILAMVKKNVKSTRDFLSNAALLIDMVEEAKTLLGGSGLAEEIWSNSGAGDTPK